MKKSQVLEYIKKCWQSLHSARAKNYSHHKIDNGKMAVIVQNMITPTISGVAFSTHPVTGDRNSVIIEAVLGSNELLVQGSITPNHYVINKNFKILDKKIMPQNEIGRQKFQIIKFKRFRN